VRRSALFGIPTSYANWRSIIRINGGPDRAGRVAGHELLTDRPLQDLGISQPRTSNIAERTSARSQQIISPIISIREMLGK
jgi:hypothetical protein